MRTYAHHQELRSTIHTKLLLIPLPFAAIHSTPFAHANYRVVPKLATAEIKHVVGEDLQALVAFGAPIVLANVFCFAPFTDSVSSFAMTLPPEQPDFTALS